MRINDTQANIQPIIPENAKKNTTKKSRTEPSRESEKPQSTVVDISEDGSLAAQKAQKALEKLKEMKNWYQTMFEQLEKANEQGKGAGEALKTKMQCMQIAMRIIAGDNVPIEDYRFLMENDSGLYMQAVSMRQQNDNPRNYDRLSEDEETDNGGSNTGKSSRPAESGGATEGTEGQKGEVADE